MRIRAQLRLMAESEIRNMIPPATLAEIKKKDPSPLFKAFVVGHEGEARGNLVGVGNIVKHWFRSAVEKLHEKIQAGLQLFNGHAETNTNEGRIPIGEVVAKQLKHISDRFSTVVACWIYPSYRNLPLDVASIEADVDLEQSARAGLYVADVSQVTGIALGNSMIETPGFPGATLLGQLQAFAKDKKLGGNKPMDLTPEEIKEAIREAGLQPSDLFTKGELKADPFIVEHVKEKSANPEGYQIRKLSAKIAEAEEKAAKIEAEKKGLEEKLSTKETEIQTIKVENAKSKVGNLFETQKTERKLEDKVAKFIQARLPNFKPDKPEELDKEFSAYLDTEVDEYKKIAKTVFDIDVDADKTKPGGSEPEITKIEPDNKYLDPKTNPFIKTD